MTLDEQKAAARKTAFARRKEAHSGNVGSAAGMLSSVLAGYRGVPCAGYMPIRTEIDPTARDGRGRRTWTRGGACDRERGLTAVVLQMGT